MYTPSDTGLEWLGEGPLKKLVSKKRGEREIERKNKQTPEGINCSYYSSYV